MLPLSKAYRLCRILRYARRFAVSGSRERAAGACFRNTQTYLANTDHLADVSATERRQDTAVLVSEMDVGNKDEDTDRSAHESADKSGPFALEPEPATV